MQESLLLSQIAAATAPGFPGRPDILVGPGDDCAVVASPAGGQLLLTVDQCIEGVHYVPDASPDVIAAHAVGRSISDIAAMGGAPLYALATAALHQGYDQQRASDLCRAMAEAGLRWGCPLIGGDISATNGPAVITVTAIGTPHPNRGPVLRGGARPGDLVVVSGPLGGALASAWTKLPAPRLELARRICDTLGGALHSMIDISDGLGRDAGRIAERSGVGIEIDARKIPLAPGVGSWRDAVGAGEDYELCFTCSEPPDASLGCVVVGTVVEGAGCRVRDQSGELIDVAALGWDHHA
ncbi:MAG: thiamine-phosphate kinase [Phycisphaeraceae bacterium]|nr:thiamine-phosphate kinase [Phycisphaeraceae bacterium]MCB9848846.1 thiamine-phosphate kinase [Phycisphaeraceae bacterium]